MPELMFFRQLPLPTELTSLQGQSTQVESSPSPEDLLHSVKTKLRRIVTQAASRSRLRTQTGNP